MCLQSSMSRNCKVPSTMFSVLLAALCLVSCQADLNVADYVFWTKEGINQWHQFFPTRVLGEEGITIETAQKSLLSNISDDLKKILTFQYQELQNAQQVMLGTDAEGCISGVSKVLDQVVKEEQEEYEECTSEANSKLARIKANFNRLNTVYQSSYRRTLGGIDSCLKTYPNKASIGRLRSCIESMDNAYFTAANKTKKALSPSPAMTYFQKNVVQCASTAAENVAAKGSQFLKKLVNCASLSGTVDPVAYNEELSQWKGYNDTLTKQFSESQSKNYNQVRTVENDLFHYYNLKKEALHAYVIEPRDVSFYSNKIYSYLGDYYNTVTATSLDNPGDSECALAARTNLDAIASSAAKLSQSYDKKIVVDTKSTMSDIYDNFVNINNLLPTVGNVALLNCYSQGYIFAPNTVLDCFKLEASNFDVEYIGRDEKIDESVAKLDKYVKTFYSSTELPCGVAKVKKLFLDADTTLYTLQRCLYKSSGTSYEVTTPPTIIASTTEISNSSFSYQLLNRTLNGY